MEQQTGIEQALEKFGKSPTKLAVAVGGNVVRQHVEHWLKAKRVPADKAPDVERATGIPCELLCPDVSWDVLRGNSAQAPATPTPPATETVAGASHA